MNNQMIQSSLSLWAFGLALNIPIRLLFVVFVQALGLTPPIFLKITHIAQGQQSFKAQGVDAPVHSEEDAHISFIRPQDTVRKDVLTEREENVEQFKINECETERRLEYIKLPELQYQKKKNRVAPFVKKLAVTPEKENIRQIYRQCDVVQDVNIMPNLDGENQEELLETLKYNQERTDHQINQIKQYDAEQSQIQLASTDIIQQFTHIPYYRQPFQKCPSSQLQLETLPALNIANNSKLQNESFKSFTLDAINTSGSPIKTDHQYSSFICDMSSIQNTSRTSYKQKPITQQQSKQVRSRSTSITNFKGGNRHQHCLQLPGSDNHTLSKIYTPTSKNRIASTPPPATRSANSKIKLNNYKKYTDGQECDISTPSFKCKPSTQRSPLRDAGNSIIKIKQPRRQSRIQIGENENQIVQRRKRKSQKTIKHLLARQA